MKKARFEITSLKKDSLLKGPNFICKAGAFYYL
jgi:hypothetical protein